MHEAREAERRALYEDQVRRLWDRADGVREMRKAIRETRFWPNRYMRKLRAHYEGNEASMGTLNKLGSPKRPSWRIADDAEFERFLKEFYVDPFLKQWLN